MPLQKMAIKFGFHSSSRNLSSETFPIYIHLHYIHVGMIPTLTDGVSHWQVAVPEAFLYPRLGSNVRFLSEDDGVKYQCTKLLIRPSKWDIEGRKFYDLPIVVNQLLNLILIEWWCIDVCIYRNLMSDGSGLVTNTTRGVFPRDDPVGGFTHLTPRLIYSPVFCFTVWTSCEVRILNHFHGLI